MNALTTFHAGVHDNRSLEVESWLEANQQYLTSLLKVLRCSLEERIRSPDERKSGREEEIRALHDVEDAKAAMPAPAPLDRLCATFSLSEFERDVLMLCAGVEFDSEFASLCADAQGMGQRPFPTFSLALGALRSPHWSALSPSGPLRRWRLIEVGPGGLLTTVPLRIDERVLHYLAGVQHIDERLMELVEPIAPSEYLVPSHRPFVDRIAGTWSGTPPGRPLPIVQLYGNDASAKRDVFAVACARLGLHAWTISAETLPATPAELETFVRLWEREAVLSGTALLLEFDQSATDPIREQSATRLIELADCPIASSNREPRAIRRRRTVILEVRRPTSDEQSLLWRRALESAGTPDGTDTRPLVSQFDLSAAAIASVCNDLTQHPALAAAGGDSVARVEQLLWDLCRSHSRPRIEGLATCIEPTSTWDDLVLPTAQLEVLHEIAAQARHRHIVYEDWGFRKKSARGLGISALFVGPTGTGKTMAAEVLARELNLDLYRIDLSQVVSKYIGETEKNLRHVFDAAEQGGAILLFDEADALFGKRSEVKDSHDRYANIEISFLLQRMEAYAGLAILTTNMKDAIDSAFARRIRFVVHFPFPDDKQRLTIWSKILPAETPTEDLDNERLARMNLAGGNIRNIALRAAFLAAAAREPVRMAHLTRAARSEFAKLGRPMADPRGGGRT